MKKSFYFSTVGVILCLCISMFSMPTDNSLLRVKANSPINQSFGSKDFISSDETKSSFTVGTTPCNYKTIQEAINAAKSGDIILLEGGVTFTESLTIQKNLTIRGGYSGCGSGSFKNTTISGNNLARVIFIYENLVVVLENLNVINGYSTENGAGILINWNSDVTGNNISINNNSTTASGGGIRILGGRVTFTNLKLYGNSAMDGAGVYINQYLDYIPELNLETNTQIYENTASRNGGGLYVPGGRVNFRGTWNLSNNTANASGGAITITSNGQASFSATSGSSFINDNTATNYGGAILLGNSSTLSFNAINGFAINIQNNSCGKDGGAIHANLSGYIDNYGQVIYQGNHASTGNGGAIFLSNESSTWLDDHFQTIPKIKSNWAKNGGGIYATGRSQILCDGTEFGDSTIGNYATTGSGGAIYLDNSNLVSENCIFHHNQATQHGGAIAAFDSDLDIDSKLTLLTSSTELEKSDPTDSVKATTCDPLVTECSSFYYNVADSNSDLSGSGGAIFSSYSTMYIDLVYFHHNNADRGGAIYQEGDGSRASVNNCLFHHNHVTTAIGSGIGTTSGIFDIYQSTIADNMGGPGFSGIAKSATNNIAWGNSSIGFSSVPISSGCNIDDGGIAGLNIDPVFVDPGEGMNYHLQYGSPAIDACDTGYGVDLEGRLRPILDDYDMGAFEFAQFGVFLPLLQR